MIFFFIWTWNEFFIPLVMLTANDTQTVPIALASLQGDRLMDAPTTNAGALVSLHPGADLLPHLPAHAHPRRHRRRGQVATRHRHDRIDTHEVHRRLLGASRPAFTALYAVEVDDVRIDRRTPAR